MKILADANIAGVVASFAAMGELVVRPGRSIGPADADDVDALLVRSVTRIDRSLLENSAVKFVGSATSGFDHVDRTYLQANNIGFAFAPGCNANSVVEYVLSVICSDADRLEQLLAGTPVGIVGYGVVGRALHRCLQALGITCCACDPWLERRDFPLLTDLERVLECSVVCLHAALTDQPPWPSRHLLNGRNLGDLQEHALLINAGRGPLIDSLALRDLLACRSDLSVALDVWEFEPAVDRQLMERCAVATPHIAGYSHDGKVRATRMLLRAFCDFFAVTCVDNGKEVPGDVLNVPSRLGGADLVRWLQFQTYQVRQDDFRMREALGEGFDRLRSQYPLRRELSGFALGNPRQLQASALRICRALGLRAGKVPEACSETT